VIYCGRQSSDAGLLHFKPARQLNSSQRKPLIRGCLTPRYFAKRVQATSSVGGFGVMDKRKNWLSKEEYRKKLLDPRWQKKRLKILERDGFECRFCHSTTSTLHVHHRAYGDGEPWDVPDFWLETLCEDCHASETENRPGVEQHLLRRMRILGLTSEDLGIIHDCLDGIGEPDIPAFIRALMELDAQHRADRTGCYGSLPEKKQEGE
jgi:5-methylcytosine-specific restriction endonuclease McrA